MKEQRRKNRITKAITGVGTMMFLMSAMAMTAFADGEPAKSKLEIPKELTDILSFFVSLIQIAGGVVGFIGAIMFFFALKNDDAHQKQQGLTTLLAGAGVFAVATVFKAGNLFG